MLKVWGILSMLSWIHTLLCDGIQKLETEDATLPLFPGGFFSAWQWRYLFSQGENPSVDMYFTQSLRSWVAVGDSVETSWAKLPIKDQSKEVSLQDRCENVSWTCTLSAEESKQYT